VPQCPIAGDDNDNGVKCNNDYSVQNDASPCGHCKIREESESGIRK